MTDKKPASPRQMLFFGAVTAAAGAYFVLVGIGLLPIPGGPGNLYAPLWVLLCAGLAFLLTGIVLLMQRFGRADANGEFPPDAPQWMRPMQYVTGVAIFATFAMIGSWIAFGPGERRFSGTFLFFDAQTNETIGRAMFGVGAVISWLCMIAFVVFRGRNLLGGSKHSE